MTHHHCEACGHEVDPEDSDVVHAVEIVQAGGFGATRHELEGMGVFFDESCFDEGDPRYRRRSGPTERA